MKKYEYKVVGVNLPMVQVTSEFDALGREGWILVAVDKGLAFFIRKMP